MQSCDEADMWLVQDIVTWKGELYFVDEPTADAAKLDNSLVAFTKNGVMQGIAYRSFPLPHCSSVAFHAW